MTEMPKRSMFAGDSIAAPLRHSVFRRIWLASLLSNLGLLIQGVGAAWAMTLMTSSADKVALVQTALMLPIMLISMPAGAIADMYDRRIVALVSLSISLVGATALAVMAWRGLVTPNILLAFCFVVGCGMALFGPAWQASVSEQVPAETLPSAVALERHQLQHRAKFWAGDRRHRGRDRRRGRRVCRQRAAVYSVADRAVPVAPRHRTLATAARKTQPRHRFRRALYRQLAVDPHRADAHAGHRSARRVGVGADAAGRARSAAWRRADLWHHARRVRHGRGDRRAEYRRGAQTIERRSCGAGLRADHGRRDRRDRDQQRRRC